MILEQPALSAKAAAKDIIKTVHNILYGMHLSRPRLYKLIVKGNKKPYT